MMKWFWLSFATDTEALGVAIVQGMDLEDATLRARALGINPGGEVMGYPIDENNPDTKADFEMGVNRLISPEELIRHGYMRRGEIIDVTEGQVDDKGQTFEEYEKTFAGVICEDHNQVH